MCRVPFCPREADRGKPSDGMLSSHSLYFSVRQVRLWICDKLDTATRFTLLPRNGLDDICQPERRRLVWREPRRLDKIGDYGVAGDGLHPGKRL